MLVGARQTTVTRLHTGCPALNFDDCMSDFREYVSLQQFNLLLFSGPTFPFSHQFFQTRSSSECFQKMQNDMDICIICCQMLGKCAVFPQSKHSAINRTLNNSQSIRQSCGRLDTLRRYVFNDHSWTHDSGTSMFDSSIFIFRQNFWLAQALL